MKEYSQMQKFISVVMIFILLAYLSGCTTTRIIPFSKDELPLPDSSRYSEYSYMVHSDKSKFLLEKPTISNGILTGRFKQVFSDKSYDNNKIHLYLSSDSVIKIEMGGIISVPLIEVTKTEIQIEENNEVKTFLLIVGIVGFFVGVWLVGFAISYHNIQL
jgi:hypothetical protein